MRICNKQNVIDDVPELYIYIHKTVSYPAII